MKVEIIASPELLKFGAPKMFSEGAAGLDLRMLHRNQDAWNITLYPGEQYTVGTGLRIHLDHPGYFGLVVPRSSTGKRGIVLGNGTGVIDSDYQGEIQLVLCNRGTEALSIDYGERVAQLLIVPVQRPELDLVSNFSHTSQRGEAGFGSTGNQ